MSQNHESRSHPGAVDPLQTQLRLVSIAGITFFVAAVVVLHGLEADLTPVNHTISDYALGPYGWLMRAAFASLGLGVLTTAIRIGLHSRFSSPWGLLVASLALCSVGLFLDAGFNTDHPGVSETPTGAVHGLGMLIICVTLPLASLILGQLLTRQASTLLQGRRLQVIALGQIMAIVAFELSPPLAGRGWTERVSVIAAIACLTLMQSTRITYATETVPPEAVYSLDASETNPQEIPGWASAD